MTIYGQGQQFSGYQTSSSYSSYTGSARGNGGSSSDSEENVFCLDESGGADSVSLSAANQALIMADDNRDGIVDRQELANASYQLLSNEDATDSDTAVGRLFGTMVLGGQDGEGLYPDINQDGGITSNELALLARGDDDTEAISIEDFTLAYGDEANPEGSSFTLEDLEAAAMGQATGSTGESGIGDTQESGPGQPSVDDPGVTESVVSILGSIVELLGVASGQTNTTQAPASPEQETESPAQQPEQPAGSEQPASTNPATAIVSIITSLLTLLIDLFGGQGQQEGQATQ